MSDHSAIAAVTAALHVRLRRALRVTGLNADVSHTRPGTTNAFPNQVGMHAFMYMVTPSAALRNIDLPMRDGRGRIISRPSVALELHYLLSFVGDEAQHEPQRMLGAVALELYTHPVLTPDEIRTAMESGELASLPRPDRIEQVRLIPEAIDLEEFSKLWSVFFQTQYLLSTAYRASVVLLEADVAVRAVMRVREPRARVAPLPPTITSVEPQIVQPGARLVIHGSSFVGDSTTVRFVPERGGAIEADPQVLLDDRLEVSLPADLPAGLHTVQVVTRDVATAPELPPRTFAFESGALPFMLVPRMVEAGGSSDEPRTRVEIEAAVGSAVTLDIVPRILDEQEVRVLVGAVQIEPIERVSEGDDTTRLTFEIPDDPELEPGQPHPLRVQVDRAVSLVEEHEDGFAPRLIVTGGS